MHPLAGQGLNQGILDVRALYAVLVKAMEVGQDVGSVFTLETYASERYLQNHVIMGVLDKLHKLYSYESGPFVQLRSWGLKMINEVDILKGAIMRQASR